MSEALQASDTTTAMSMVSDAVAVSPSQVRTRMALFLSLAEILLLFSDSALELCETKYQEKSSQERLHRYFQQPSCHA